jgi:hypothetical protein
VRFPDGVMALDLDDLRPREAKVLDPMDIAGSLLRKLGVPPEWSGSSFAEALSRYRTKMEGLRVATIIDNARFSSEVEPLLAAGR